MAQEAMNERGRFLAALEDHVSSNWRPCKVVPYGSTVTLLSASASDVDVMVEVDLDGLDAKEALQQLADCLQTNFLEVCPIGPS
eukprot:5293468-Pyramimonas_sp.AAC.1